MEEQAKVISKKRLSPEATLILTIAGIAIGTIMCGLIHFIITRI